MILEGLKVTLWINPWWRKWYATTCFSQPSYLHERWRIWLNYRQLWHRAHYYSVLDCLGTWVASKRRDRCLAPVCLPSTNIHISLSLLETTDITANSCFFMLYCATNMYNNSLLTGLVLRISLRFTAITWWIDSYTLNWNFFNHRVKFSVLLVYTKIFIKSNILSI